MTLKLENILTVSPDTHIDNTKRTKFIDSKLEAFLHPLEKRRINNVALKEIKTFFQTRYNLDENKLDRTWKIIGAPHLDLSKELTAKDIQNIDKVFQQQLAYSGNGIQSPKKALTDTSKGVHDAVQYLFHGGEFTSAIKQKEILHSVFVERNKELMDDFKKEIQNEFDNLYDNLPKTESEKLIWQAFRGNLLALFPFCYPEKGSISVPQLGEDGIVRKVDYDFETLHLHIENAPTPMNALGLTPKDPKEPPILIYLGTTYPAGDGFGATILADFAPGYSVGDKIFHNELEQIEKWMEGKKNVHLAGTSLGGALCFLTLRAFESQIQRADVYNPPGVYKGFYKTPITIPEVNIYSQEGDIVSQLGGWPEGDKVNVYNVTTSQPGIKKNFISSHVRIFTGCEKVTITKHSPKQDNQSKWRRFLSVLHHYAGPLVLYYPLNFTLYLSDKLLALKNRVSEATKKVFKRP